MEHTDFYGQCERLFTRVRVVVLVVLVVAGVATEFATSSIDKSEREGKWKRRK